MSSLTTKWIFIPILLIITALPSTAQPSGAPSQTVTGNVTNSDISIGSIITCNSASDCHIRCDSMELSTSNCNGNTFIFPNIWDATGNSVYHSLTCLHSSCKDITIIANTTSLNLYFDATAASSNEEPAATKVFAFINLKPASGVTYTIPTVNITCLGNNRYILYVESTKDT